MSKEATKSAQAMIDENELDIEVIEGTGAEGKVTLPDVENYMAADEAEDDNEQDDDESNDSDETDADEEAEDTESEEDDDEGETSDDGESKASEEAETDKSDDSEPKSETKRGKRGGKGKLVCRLTIKGQRKSYKPGDVYDGDNVKHLLKRGAIYRK